ncbi:branched-chain amino acid ABC transporter permease [Microbaculum marinum]|uniref:Branched-chain amino acid ABC transporter permease n=1 Tax=Microbaculum marinum TaxID=1764581 RepID=A0AAW9RWX0_9HYPH
MTLAEAGSPSEAPAAPAVSGIGTTRIKAAIAVVLIVAFAALPLIDSDQFTISLGTTLLITGIATTSLHLIIRTGHVSLAHAAFMGLGAYASVIAVVSYRLPYPVAILLAFLAPAAVALVVGPLLLRLSGKYFVLVTFLLGEIIRLVFVSWQSFTGGSNGIFGIPVPYAFLESPIAFFYFALGFALVCIGFVARLLQSEIGRSIDAIREDPRLAECSGIPVLRVKVTMFVIACGLAGISGALFGSFVRYIDPTSFSIIQSLNFVVMNIVGGMHQLIGPIVGTLFFVILPEFLRGYVELQRVFFGVSLILVMAFLPGGIIELVARLRRLLGRGREASA